MLKLIIGKIKESFFVHVPVWNSLRLMNFSVIIISLGLSYQINIDTPHASWSFIDTIGYNICIYVHENIHELIHPLLFSIHLGFI